MTPAPPVIVVRPDERVWVTGDVHLSPHDDERVEFFLRFFRAARESTDRLVILGDLFDYWIGPRHGRLCSYRPVIEAFEAATADGFVIDFIAGNRDFLGPDELRSLGLQVHGDLVVYDRGGERTVVTHGDLLVKGDHSYRRFRRAVRSGCFSFLYWAVPTPVRIFGAKVLRGASERKLVNVEPYSFPIDLETSQAWLRAHDARELLMGHLHREEVHEHAGTVTRMLPGWSADRGPHFVLGPAAELEQFQA